MELQIPLLPIRNAIIFPGISLPLSVSRVKSVAAFKHAHSTNGYIVVTTQKESQENDPLIEGLNHVGTLCKIENSMNTDKDQVQIVLTGVARFQIRIFSSTDPFFMVEGEQIPDIPIQDENRKSALLNHLKELGKEIISLLPTGNGPQLKEIFEQINDVSYLSYLAASYLNLPISEKQGLLSETSVEKRIDIILEHMRKEREVLSIQSGINSKLNQRFTKVQREALLREQIKAIRNELGEEENSVVDKLRKKIEEASLPEDAKKIAESELRRLEDMPTASAEHHVVRTYLEWLSDMPWSKSTNDKLEFHEAKSILDRDHYGLDQVKKRILQFLAVTQLKNNLKGPILCLVGPPGVGKTSLGQSIAKSLGRKFIRASLGGIRDESEIRGHRRTYVGAMPGRIVQSLKRSGVRNPVILLDEIDKLGSSFQGDPSSALLEVLDPEQNTSFTDHYLDTPFDLSNVFFIATANVMENIPSPLRDRMEVIDLHGYTTDEKCNIGRNHLLPKQLEDHGLTPDQVQFSDDALNKIISSYTREAGVRELQRKIASVCRAVAEDVVAKAAVPVCVTPEKVISILGIEKFHHDFSERTVRAGIVTGLAWTPVGGDILFVEATSMPGTGKLTLTGQLGDVMKESAQIALSYIRSESNRMAPSMNFDKIDIHIHVPHGAIPKDGPSAGITILTALASLFTGRVVDPKLAMTGETTLRGAVLPIGGVKEKILAAHRAGIQTILLPQRNASDLKDIPEFVLKTLKIEFVETCDDVLQKTIGALPIFTQSPHDDDHRSMAVT